jgi:hypothetical protein
MRKEDGCIIMEAGPCEVEIIDIRGVKYLARHERIPLARGTPAKWTIAFVFNPHPAGRGLSPDEIKQREEKRRVGALLDSDSPRAADGSFFDLMTGPPRRMRVVFPGKFYFQWDPDTPPDLVFRGRSSLF